MRILHLRFKNLNSLAGEWRIDFTHPAYVSSGIFAITGPTGSGKTTILDAICLALYGQTPRLKTISKSTNEIMTRNTGECFAEVIFESQVGQFICHWSQRRAYGKPNGDLQQPKHEISDYSSKKILENKLSKVQDKIIETTGLDYNQFTRSILLAQGDFATFLNANPDERAPILEKITGTAIYSEISKKVHERNVLEDTKRRELKEKIGNLNLLSPEKVLELKETSEKTEKEIQKKSSDRDALRQAVTWLQNLSRLEQEISSLKSRKEILDKKRFESTGELACLSRARKTVMLEGIFSKVISARNIIEKYTQEINDNKGRLDASEISHKKSLVEFEKIKKYFESLKESFERENRVIIQVRDLDTRIKEIDKQIAERYEDLKQYQDRILQYQQLILSSKQKAQEKTTLLSTATSYLEEKKEDSRLLEFLSGLEERLAQYSRLVETLQSHKEHLESEKNERSQLNASFSHQKTLLSDKTQEFKETTKELQKLEARYHEHLDDRDPQFWCRCATSLKERKTKLESEIKIFESIDKITIRIRDLQENHVVLEEELREKKKIFSELESEQKVKEELIEKLEKNLEILHRVESLEEERNHLEDGKPCPLCGSTNHPFAIGNIPNSDKEKSEYRTIREELANILEKYRLLGNSIAKKEADLHLNEETVREKKLHIKELLEESKLGFDSIEFAMESHDLKKILQKAVFYCDQHLVWCADVCESANEMEELLNDTRLEASTIKDTLTGISIKCTAAEVELGTFNKNIAKTENLLAGYLTDLQRLHQELFIDLREYGIDFSVSQNIEEIILSLKQRKEDFENSLTTQKDLEKEISLISKDIEKYHEQLNIDELSAEHLLQLIKDKRTERREISDQRSSIYGTKDPNIEEKTIIENLNTAEKDFHTASDTKNEYGIRVTSLQEQMVSQTEILRNAQNTLKDLEKEFLEGIRSTGLLNEEDFISARIPQSKFESLEKLEHELLFEERDISSRFEETTRILDFERSREMTDKTLEDLEGEVNGNENTIANLNRVLGSINQELQGHEQLMMQERDLVNALEKQEIECVRWEKLHNLIGSADGKRFRVFAQGLTFDRLIAHANIHLRKMSDRYLLIRMEGSSLDLDIMDNYQAGEIRSTKNLSGGESFIVSLSLALGLSGMASRNVQIDSLFLDEGFGTLDNETLEIALETLSNLQQEGKIIGIISHVSTLQERIPTKIIVEKTSGGRSRLIAPGCMHISV
jgi:exonuclease SbcC